LVEKILRRKCVSLALLDEEEKKIYFWLLVYFFPFACPVPGPPGVKVLFFSFQAKLKVRVDEEIIYKALKRSSHVKVINAQCM
jgi:hypothetical protein